MWGSASSYRSAFHVEQAAIPTTNSSSHADSRTRHDQCSTVHRSADRPPGPGHVQRSVPDLRAPPYRATGRSGHLARTAQRRRVHRHPIRGRRPGPQRQGVLERCDRARHDVHPALGPDDVQAAHPEHGVQGRPGAPAPPQSRQSRVHPAARQEHDRRRRCGRTRGISTESPHRARSISSRSTPCRSRSR